MNSHDIWLHQVNLVALIFGRHHWYSKPQALEPEAVNELWRESGDPLGVLAKETHWFGLGRTPHPVQAGNIWSICLLKQKKAVQGAQVLLSPRHPLQKEGFKETPKRLIQASSLE